jgi:hypothetical protein
MNDLIQSLPSPSPTAGITHTWMGESWMVDGETSVMMVMKISSKSSSRQGARTEFLVLNRGFWWWRCSGSLSRKNAEPPIVSGQKVFVGGRRARGDGWGGLTTPWRGQAWAAPPGGVVASQPLFVSYSGSMGLLVKYDFCSIFRDFSWKLDFCTKTRHQGNLLKTALVHVSCIRNTQIIGETTTKVFGKVDTFWTYQLPLLTGWWRDRTLNRAAS